MYQARTVFTGSEMPALICERAVAPAAIVAGCRHCAQGE